MTDYKAPTPGKGQPHPIPEGVVGLERLVNECANPEQRAIIGLCGFVGLRLGEALACNISWLSAPTMTLRVRGKGDKERFVPVSERAWETIGEAYAIGMIGNGSLVNYQDRSARKVVTALGKKAGLSRPIASHDLRATFATAVYNKTRDIRLVQELLGHANSSTTEIYTGVERAAMAEAVGF